MRITCTIPFTFDCFDEDGTETVNTSQAPARFERREPLAAGIPMRDAFRTVVAGTHDWQGDVRQSGAVQRGADSYEPSLVISEIGIDYGGGPDCDYVELYNPSSVPLGPTGGVPWRVAVMNAGGNVGVNGVTITETVGPGQYYLVAGRDADCDFFDDGTLEPDATGDPFFVVQRHTIALVRNDEPVTGCNDPDIEDLVGIGQSWCARPRGGQTG